MTYVFTKYIWLLCRCVKKKGTTSLNHCKRWQPPPPPPPHRRSESHHELCDWNPTPVRNSRSWTELRKDAEKSGCKGDILNCPKPAVSWSNVLGAIVISMEMTSRARKGIWVQDPLVRVRGVCFPCLKQCRKETFVFYIFAFSRYFYPKRSRSGGSVRVVTSGNWTLCANHVLYRAWAN